MSAPISYEVQSGETLLDIYPKTRDKRLDAA